jgi:uncharacterized protein YndB with AHSA1/START domain
MTNAIDASEVLAAPADRVWAVLTDWSGMSRWMGGAEELRGPNPPAVGGTLAKEDGAQLAALKLVVEG